MRLRWFLPAMPGREVRVTPGRRTSLAVGIAATALLPLVSLDRFIFFFPDRSVPPAPPGVVERLFSPPTAGTAIGVAYGRLRVCSSPL